MGPISELGGLPQLVGTRSELGLEMGFLFVPQFATLCFIGKTRGGRRHQPERVVIQPMFGVLHVFTIQRNKNK